MRFDRKLLSLLAVACLSLPATAPASVIFSTGEGPAVMGGLILDGGHWRALAFTLSDRSTITDVEGWIAVFGGSTYTVGLYDGSTGSPGTSLFSAAATAPGGVGWMGVHGLSVTLDPGSYWAGFEIRPGQNLGGVMPDPVPSPTPAAFGFGDGSWCCVEFGLHMGLRIQGELAPAPVPEPATLTLLGVGIVALGYTSSRRRRQSSNV